MSANRVLQLQAIAFAIYGIGFFLIPDVINDAIFGWEGTEPILGRIIGASFIGLAAIEWRLAGASIERSSVLPFALIPGLFLIAFIWDGAAGTYTGSASWYWVNLAVSAVFFLLVGSVSMRLSRG